MKVRKYQLMRVYRRNVTALSSELCFDLWDDENGINIEINLAIVKGYFGLAFSAAKEFCGEVRSLVEWEALFVVLKSEALKYRNEGNNYD